MNRPATQRRKDAREARLKAKGRPDTDSTPSPLTVDPRHEENIPAQIYDQKHATSLTIHELCLLNIKLLEAYAAEQAANEAQRVIDAKLRIAKCGTILPAETKRCICCRVEKSPDQFHRRKGRRDVLQSQCKGCQAAHTRKWRESNRKRHRELARAEYARRRGLSLSQHDRLQTLKQFQLSYAQQIAEIEAMRKMP